jgi:hypothetical protein
MSAGEQGESMARRSYITGRLRGPPRVSRGGSARGVEGGRRGYYSPSPSVAAPIEGTVAGGGVIESAERPIDGTVTGGGVIVGAERPIDGTVAGGGVIDGDDGPTEGTVGGGGGHVCPRRPTAGAVAGGNTPGVRSPMLGTVTGGGGQGAGWIPILGNVTGTCARAPVLVSSTAVVAMTRALRISHLQEQRGCHRGVGVLPAPAR